MQEQLDISDPVISVETDAILLNGTKVVIKVMTFDHPIFQTGENFFSLMTMKDHNLVTAGLAFFKDKMDFPEMQDKALEVAENPDQWLSPEYKQIIMN